MVTDIHPSHDVPAVLRISAMELCIGPVSAIAVNPARITEAVEIACDGQLDEKGEGRKRD